jgi:hypothetical protein
MKMKFLSVGQSITAYPAFPRLLFSDLPVYCIRLEQGYTFFLVSLFPVFFEVFVIR